MVTSMNTSTNESTATHVGDEKVSGGESSATVVLHPLVVMNISDHQTRFNAMKIFPEAAQRNSLLSDENKAIPLIDANGNVRVIGVLLGEQDGRSVEVCHSFELHGHVSDDGKTVVDIDFMQKRIEQYKQIFPRYTVVGWYSTGTTVVEDDFDLHTTVFSVLNESPVLLVINPDECNRAGGGPSVGSTSTRDASMVGRQSAIVAYQVELRLSGEELTPLLVPVPHRFASADSERIAVDHVTRHAVPGGDASSSTVMHLGTLRRSIIMLQSRVQVIVRFLEATKAGEIPEDHELLRKVYGVCSSLPVMNSDTFSEAFEGEQNDSMVVSYLSGVTKSLCAMNDLVTRFNLAYEKTPITDAKRKAHYLV